MASPQAPGAVPAPPILIPKVFHRIWFGGDLPEEYRQYGETWTALHPGWELRTWDEASLPRLVNRAAFARAANPAEQADIARYEVLHRFGGVYVDADLECLRSIEPLLAGVSFFAGWEDDLWINNACFGCVPGHPIAAALVADLAHSVIAAWDRTTNERTGPQFFTRVVNRVRAEQPEGVVIFPPAVFYPYHFSEPERASGPFPDAFAVHHWSGSWKPQVLDETDAASVSTDEADPASQPAAAPTPGTERLRDRIADLERLVDERSQEVDRMVLRLMAARRDLALTALVLGRAEEAVAERDRRLELGRQDPTPAVAPVPAAAVVDVPRYLSRYGPLAPGVAPADDFVGGGWRLGRQPNALFSVSWYLSHPGAADAVAASGLDPLTHYLAEGWRNGWDPHPLFHTSWYLDTYPEVARAGVHPFVHFLHGGHLDGYDPCPLFDTSWYLRRHPELAAVGVSPVTNWLDGGWTEDRDPHPLFRTAWYLARYPDAAAAVGEAGVDPLSYFLTVGVRAGHDPSPLFEQAWYRANYLDAAESGRPAVLHYLAEGLRRGHHPSPLARRFSEESMIHHLERAS